MQAEKVLKVERNKKAVDRDGCCRRTRSNASALAIVYLVLAAMPVAAKVAVDSMSPTSGWAGTTASNGTLVKLKGQGFDATPAGNDVRFAGSGGKPTVKATVAWASSDGNAYAFSKYIGKPGSGGGGLNKPWDIAVDAGSGHIYVVNKDHKRIEVFNSGGGFVRMLGSGSLTAPWAVDVDPKGNVYVSDQVTAAQGHIAVFDKNGSKTKTIGSTVLKAPRDLVVDKSGAVYVIDNNDRFFKFLANGQQIFSLPGPLHRKFKLLSGIAMDPFGYPGGSLYLTDRSNRSVYQYNYYGLYIGHQNVSDYPLPTGATPEGIAVDSNGTVIVQVGDGYYAKLDTALKWLGEIEIKSGPVGNAHMRAVDASKRLYAVDYVSNVLKVFTPADTGEIWVRVPPGAHTGPLQVKNTGGAATTGTFTVLKASGSVAVDEVALSQGLSHYPFVVGKETLVYAKLKGLFGQPGSDSATVAISGPGIASAKAVAFDHFDYDPVTKITTGHFHVPDGRIRQAGDFTFRVQIARGGKTYYKKDLPKTFSETKASGLVFTRFSDVPNAKWNTQDPFPWFDWGSFLNMIANYRRTYPLHAAEIQYRFAGDQYAPELADGKVNKKDRSDLSWKAQLALNKFSDEYFPGVRKVIGIVDHAVQREPGLGGVAPLNKERALIFGLSGSRLVHELGHSFGLVPKGWPNHNAANEAHSINSNFSAEAGAPLTVWNSTDDALYPGSGSGNAATVMNPGGGGGRGLFESEYKNTKVDYWHLFNRFKNSKNPVTASRSSAVVQSSTAGEAHFAVVGTVDSGGDVRIGHSQLVKAPAMPAVPGAGDYSLVFRDGRGAILQYHPFAPTFDQGDGGVSERGTFSLVYPFPAATKSVEIWRQQSILRTLAPSDNPPTVSNVTVTAAENQRPVIRWAAGDRDGDPLSYTLYVTPNPDSGKQPIVSGIADTAYIWDTALLGGSPEAVVTVVASDGFHTASAASEPFELPKQAPHVAIIHPDGPKTFLEGQRVFLRGLGIDAEDGILSGKSLAWRLGDRVDMGSGETVDATTALPRLLSSSTQRMPLPPGEHKIRLTATDSDGNTASDAVTVRVVADADRDGLSDALERACGSDPADPLSTCPTRSYAVKFVCGLGEDRLAARGRYRTAIDIRNPERTLVTARWRVSPAGLPSPATRTENTLMLEADQTRDIGCAEIAAAPGPVLRTGFVIVESPIALNVVAVYTVSGADGQAESIHTERVMPQAVQPCADLVVDSIERPQWQDREDRSVVRAQIRNAGNARSAASTARLTDHAAAGEGGSPTVIDAVIPALSVGATHLATFYLPYWVYDRDVHLQVNADPADAVAECSETNNTHTFRDQG